MSRRLLLPLLVATGCGGPSVAPIEQSLTPAKQIAFALPVQTPTSLLFVPRSLVVADFDVDGNNDVGGLYVTESGHPLMLVFFGAGDGSFGTPKTTDLDADNGPIATGDFDGDGYLDIATTTMSPGTTIHIRRGLGDGTFALAEEVTLSSTIVRMIGRDLDGDRYDDLLAASGASLVVLHSVFGTLTPTSYAAPDNIADFALGDVNNDGLVDVAATLHPAGSAPLSTASIWLGRPRAKFGPAATVDTGTIAGPLVLADTSGDGNLDLVVTAAPGGEGVRVLRGRGDGTFRRPVTSALDRTPSAFFDLGDTDGDGTSDLAVTTTEIGIVVLHGRSNGTLRRGAEYDAPMVVTSGYIDGDAGVDLVWATGGDGEVIRGTLSTMIATPDGHFRAPRRFFTGGIPSALATPDIDGDGVADALVADQANDTVKVYLSRNGLLRPVSQVASGVSPVALATADFTSDGNVDFVVADIGANAVVLFAGDGTGTFVAGAVLSTPGVTNVLTGDIDGDGNADLAVSVPSGLDVYFGTGAGMFSGPVPSGIGGIAALGDANGDGRDDLFAATADQLRTVLGTSTRTFGAPVVSPGAMLPAELITGDFDGDGKLDVVVGRATFVPIGTLYGVALQTGNGSGGFAPPVTVPGAGGVGGIRLAAADFDGDGVLDLASASFALIAVTRGGPTMTLATVYSSHTFEHALSAADVTGSHRPDVVALDFSLMVLRNVSR